MIYNDKTQKTNEFLIKQLKLLQISSDLLERRCEDLSGGEKERIAILRAIINNPKILLCDEPTGSLDVKNSESVMCLLKQISKERLVIIVSHNEKLVNKYADHIIRISDGKNINEDEPIAETKFNNENKIPISKQSSKWVKYFSWFNVKKHFKRNLVSITSLIIGLVSSMIIIGFSSGYKNSIIDSAYKQLDFGSVTFTREVVQQIPGSKITLVKMLRPDYEEYFLNETLTHNFILEPNTDSIIQKYPLFSIGEETIDDICYQPVYSFSDNFIDHSLLIDGFIPSVDNLYEVVINKNAFDYLSKKINTNPLDLELTLYSEFEYHFYTDDISNPVITDYLIYEKNIRIVGVVDEFQFLSIPKIYYPFLSLKDYLQNSILNNQSKYLNESINWYDLLLTSTNNDSITSYSYRLFLNDYHKNNIIEETIKTIESPLKIESNALTIRTSLLDLMNAATIGMELFLVICILGTALLIGIISYSSYSEDRKTSAILTCLGAEKNKIFLIYLLENLFIGIVALILSFVIAPVLTLISNKIILQFTGLAHMILNPFDKYLGVYCLLPFILLICTFLICIVSTYLPLWFSKKISPKEELVSE